MSEEKRKINIGAVVILIISAVVFIPFGGSAVFDAFFSAGNTSFGKINGEKIKYEPGSDFYNAVANTTNLYKETYKVDASNPFYTKTNVTTFTFFTGRTSLACTISRSFSASPQDMSYLEKSFGVTARLITSRGFFLRYRRAPYSSPPL